jgi:hypothetical protein
MANKNRKVMVENNGSVKTDVTVENHGSIFLFRPHTDSGREWIEQHIPEDALTLGDAVAVEHRYALDIAKGMQGDGLVVR